MMQWTEASEKKTYKFKNRKEVSKVEPMCLYENELKSFISLQNRTDGRKVLNPDESVYKPT